MIYMKPGGYGENEHPHSVSGETGLLDLSSLAVSNGDFKT